VRKVLFVIATLDPAGAERQLVYLATGLDRRRYEPTVCCLTRGGPFEAELAAAGIDCVVLGKKAKYDFTVVWRLASLIRETQPDIVHTWLFTGNAFGRTAAVLAQAPVIVAGERCVDEWKRWPHRLIDRLLTLRTDAVIANAEAIKRYCVATIGLPRDRIRVIPNGIDLRRVRRHPPEGVREQLGIPPGSYVIGTAGRLETQKGIEFLIEAQAVLVRKGLEVVTLILGQGELADALKARALRLGVADTVKFLGNRSDIWQLYPLMDVFVLASLWEGLPNVVIEAMASGRPVVATDVGGTGEIVRDGATGYLVPPREPDALADRIAVLLEDADARKMLGRAGRARVEQCYSIEAMVRATESVYEELLT